MLKITYFKKLCCAARWLLPQKEAAELMEDYRDMIAEVGEEHAEEKFGPPAKVALAVADRREVVGWHLVLGAILVFLFFMVHWTLHATFYSIASLAMVAVAVGLLFLWFGCDVRRNPFKGLPKRFLFSLIPIIVLIILLLGPIYFLPRFLVSPYMFDEWGMVATILQICVLIFAVVGGAGVILARLFDRRWRAVAVLSFTVICMSIHFLSILYNMNPTFSAADHLFANSRECMFIAGAGILTAGLGLC